MTKTKLIKTASGMEVEQDGKSYPVRSEDEISFCEYVRFTNGFLTEELIEALSQGIEIPSEWVEIVRPDENGITMFEPFVVLLTEDKEGEGQEKLVNEYFDGLIEIDKKLLQKHIHNQLIYDISISNQNQLNMIREVMIRIIKSK